MAELQSGYSKTDSKTNVEADSFARILRDLGLSTKDLVQGEMALFKAEAKMNLQELRVQFTKLVVFALVALVSSGPLCAFLVIGLGKILNENYWLSSLIVGAVLALIGGGLAYRTLQEVKGKSAKGIKDGIELRNPLNH